MDIDELLKYSLYLPKYLTDDEKESIRDQLKAFPDKINYYLGRSSEEWLQGDGWTGFVLIDFATTQKKDVSGVVMSSSCDIDPTHDVHRPRNVVFSPLVDLGRYLKMCKEQGKTQAQIQGIEQSIKEQKVFDVFYLPRIEGVISESILLLDNLHVHPLNDFASKDKAKLFTLSQVGVYMFLFKLSVHFTRMTEGVRRTT